MPLGTEVGFGEGHSVLDGDPAPPRLKKGAQLLPNFSAHACYGQTAGLIKMPLGTEVGLVQATLCWMGTQLPPQRGTAPPQFSAHVCCGLTAGLIKISLGTEVGLGPGDIK